jgi:hypothetical protein
VAGHTLRCSLNTEFQQKEGSDTGRQLSGHLSLRVVFLLDYAQLPNISNFEFVDKASANCCAKPGVTSRDCLDVNHAIKCLSDR